MTTWQAVTWLLARAGGYTAYILLTLAVVEGLALSAHWQTARWPRLINNEMHNFLTLLALVFTGVHVLAVWIDPFTRFRWNEVFIPLASHYRPVWMALGIVALYLGLAVAASTLVRPWIGYAAWHRLHLATFGVFLLTTVHGIATGSDTRTWWGALIFAAASFTVGTLLLQRVLAAERMHRGLRRALATATLMAIFIGTVWTVAGPMQAGWNAIANNGNGTGGTIPTSSTR